MAYAELSGEYARRLADPSSFVRVNNAERAMLQVDGAVVPYDVRLGRGLLLFGNFFEKDMMSCIPWIAMNDEDSSKSIVDPGHYLAINELKKGSFGFSPHKYVYSSRDVVPEPIWHHAWSSYVWRHDGTDRIQVAVPDYNIESGDVRAKISILEQATCEGQTMAKHDVYMSGQRISDTNTTKN